MGKSLSSISLEARLLLPRPTMPFVRSYVRGNTQLRISNLAFYRGVSNQAKLTTRLINLKVFQDEF